VRLSNLSHSTLACTAAVLLLSSASAQSTERVSVDSAGVQGNNESRASSISDDGRFIGFSSDADNLVPGDTNGSMDVFMHELLTGQTSRVSVDSAGVEGNSESNGGHSVSGDGCYVAFCSLATNLVPGDTNGRYDVFVHDRLTGQTSRVSLDSAGVEGNGTSLACDISADGRFVAFDSGATNLVPGDTNGEADVFVHDRLTGRTSRVSVNSAGVQGDDRSSKPAISGDGRYVAFSSEAGNLASGDTDPWEDIYLHDRWTGQTTCVNVATNGTEPHRPCGYPTISSDGRHVGFTTDSGNVVPGDTNGVNDIFVHDRQTGRTSRVSVSSAGVQGNGSSGSYATFSADGRYVSFYSSATNLVPGDTNQSQDAFVHDRLTGQTSRVSMDSAGVQGNSTSSSVFISAAGRLVTFSSHSTNLVPGDTNQVLDVFVHDRGPALPSLGRIGTCPGAITLTIHGATAGGQAAFVSGAAGVFVKPTPPCAGLILGISPPALTAIVTANLSGTAVLSFNAPSGFCGRSVQGVDLTTCTPTNLIVF